MGENQNVKNFPNNVGVTEERCSGCQRPKNECICIEGYHTLNNGWHVKKYITAEEIEQLFLETYGVYKNGLVNSEGKVLKIGTDKENSYYFGAKHFFLKRVLEIVLKEYEESKFYEYQSVNLIGFQNGILVGTIPQILPSVHTAYSWYLDLIHTDLTLSSQIGQVLNKGIDLIKELVDVFGTLDTDKMNALMQNFNQVKRDYNEITGLDDEKKEKDEEIVKE